MGLIRPPSILPFPRESPLISVTGPCSEAAGPQVAFKVLVSEEPGPAPDRSRREIRKFPVGKTILGVNRFEHDDGCDLSMIGKHVEALRFGKIPLLDIEPLPQIILEIYRSGLCRRFRSKRVAMGKFLGA